MLEAESMKKIGSEWDGSVGMNLDGLDMSV
jgi:hypothetical protein